MNRFLISTKRILDKHGVDVIYKSVVNSTYDVEQGKTISTITEYTRKMYPKHIRANQYQFPNLIGKDVILFYLANDTLPFTIKVGDLIAYKGVNYKILEFQEHIAEGDIVLFRITTVRG